VQAINDLGVVNVADPDTRVFRGFEYSHMCSFCTLLFYAINMDAVSLFTDSSFLFLANLHCIHVLYNLNE